MAPPPRAEPDPDAPISPAAAAMWAEDRASQALGMALLEARPGHARMTMTVRPDMTNGLAICHGGFVFALADSAFAFACNAGNRRTVAQHCAVSFLAPAQAGDRLIAEARLLAEAGRSGIYDVTVATRSGTLLAAFRGHARQIGGHHTEPDATG